jgi:hypothetical protein
MSSRCQRSSVAGVTRKMAQRSRLSRRASEASTARSACEYRGRATWRRSTASWWAEHGDLDVLLVGRRANPEEVQEPANQQERQGAAHADDRATFTAPLLREWILRLHPSGTHAVSRPRDGHQVVQLA